MVDLLAEPSDHDDGMAFVPAPAVPVDQRTAAINSDLSFDTTQPIGPLNQPKLYIVDDLYTKPSTGGGPQARSLFLT